MFFVKLFKCFLNGPRVRTHSLNAGDAYPCPARAHA